MPGIIRLQVLDPGEQHAGIAEYRTARLQDDAVTLGNEVRNGPGKSRDVGRLFVTVTDAQAAADIDVAEGDPGLFQAFQ